MKILRMAAPFLLISLLGCPATLPSGPACGATPPPTECCTVLWGSVHGSVTDPGGQPLSGAQVTMRTRVGLPLGNCAPQLTVTTNDEGYYQFDVVPFDVPLEVTVVPAGRSSGQTKTTTVPKGPMVVLDFAF